MLICVILLVVLVGAPLIGVIQQGTPLEQYLEFPPLTRYVEHAPFALPVFIGLLGFVLVVIGPFLIKVIRSRDPRTVREAARPFPRWGWAGLLFGVVAWVLAWTRFPWFAGLQQFTFTPLWLAYIVVVNAWTFKRTGRCMLTGRPFYVLMLFVASAWFWWFFEYLNRFVQNWYYVGITDLTPLKYFVYATLPFSTVLPAVLGTCELLESVPWLSTGLDDFVRIDLPGRKPTALAVLVLACAGLAGIALAPDVLFPLLWLSPLFILTSLQALMGRETIFTPARSGRWRRIALLALASLVCGFFWEMWNYFSLAKWIYAVPYVQRFHIFEMPVLGYSGYLPFGLECAVIGDAVARLLSRHTRRNGE